MSLIAVYSRYTRDLDSKVVVCDTETCEKQKIHFTSGIYKNFILNICHTNRTIRVCDFYTKKEFEIEYGDMYISVIAGCYMLAPLS